MLHEKEKGKTELEKNYIKVYQSWFPSYAQNDKIFLMIHLYKFLVHVTNYSHTGKQQIKVTFQTITDFRKYCYFYLIDK